MTDKKSKGNGKGKSKGNSKGKSNSRFPLGMTDRKATTKASATTKATAGPSTALRSAQDDSSFLIWCKRQRQKQILRFAQDDKRFGADDNRFAQDDKRFAADDKSL